MRFDVWDRRLFALLYFVLLAAGLQWMMGPHTALASGTTFNENWNTGTDPCVIATGSTCVQTWQYASGAAATIVASSGCASGFTDTNAIKIPGNATQVGLESIGTMPYIPQAGGVSATFTFEFCYSSTADTNFAPFFTLEVPGSGSNAYQAGFWSDGSAECTFDNGSTPVACAANTHHTVTITEAPGANASSWNLDSGASTGNFTEAAHDWNAVILGGTIAGTNTYVGVISLSATGYPSGTWPPSAFMDWTGQSGNTVNAANLQTGTHCGNAGNGTTPGAWGASTLTGISYTFITDGQAFAAPLTVCGSSYAGTTNATLKMAVTTTAGASGYWGTAFTSSYSNYSAGFFFKFDSTGTFGSGVGLDFASLSNNGAVYTLQVVSNLAGTVYQLCGENNLAGMSTCSTASMVQGTWYWVAWNMTSTGANSFWWYTATGALIETHTFPGTPTDAVPGVIGLNLGKVGSETMTNSANVYYSNVITHYADAASPPLPPALTTIPNQFPRVN